MEACKALIIVQGGVIPDVPVPELTKRWSYNSSQYEQDMHTPDEKPTIYSSMLTEAHDYALGLSNPRYTNWVRVDWLWI